MTHDRYPEVDVLKTAGIVAVVLIHAMRPRWHPAHSELEMALKQLLRFGVPAFLACSGFLYASRTPVAMGTTWRRLRRILVPYLIVSCLAQVFWMVRGVGRPLATILWDLLLGNSFGHFYYVFVIVLLVLATPVIVRTPPAMLVALLLAGLVLQGLVETGWSFIVSFFWSVRDPARWVACFLLGWLVRLHYDCIRAWAVAHRSVFVLGAGMLTLVCWGVGVPDRSTLAVWVAIYGVLAALFAASCGRRAMPTIVRAVSEATYAIYLVHFFFIVLAADAWRGTTGPLALLVPAGVFLAALVGSLAVIASARALLGARARILLGA